MQSSITSTNRSLIFTSQSASTRLYSTQQLQPVRLLLKMPQYMHSLLSTLRDNITLSMRLEFNKFLKELECLQVYCFVYRLGFYSSAVLLRFQYPMMIVTRTKDIFLKRLKRNKKMLTEEGSSDESKSNTLSRSIELHTNTFLDSVNSS